MQENPSAIPHWLFQVLQSLALFGAGGFIVRLITIWQNRKKPVVEAQKTEAETTEIRIRSYSTAADSNLRMMERLQDTLDDIDRIRKERDEWRQKAEDAEAQRKIDEHFIKRVMAANELGVKLADLDKPKSS
jgi:uncharacterized coiled-coil DUF342 family protein